ncbi:MAG: right-handed parallel beta-helix repeat-containing protein [Thermoplasmata archaeon]|nr:MAG: right-handed parallel beta-helix repeat-containing protein [Thermoplasmata archaeon]
MRKKAISFVICALLIVSFFIVIYTPIVSATLIVVPDDYFTIQEAIDAANHGDIVYVRAGNYHENIFINKTITLQGEDNITTVIDGGGNGDVININADWVNVSGFTIKKSGSLTGDAGIQINSDRCNIYSNMLLDSNYGIYAYYSRYNIITNNIISLNYSAWNYKCGIILQYSNNNIITYNLVINNYYGIDIYFYSNNNTVAYNTVIDNFVGISLIYHSNYNLITDIILSNDIDINLWDRSNNNIIMNNTISGRDWGICTGYGSRGNTIYHNNFFNARVDDPSRSRNNWYHPVLLEGNYWSDYTGEDDGSGTGKHSIAGDGIGDTLIPHPDRYYDYYPLMRPWASIITSFIDIDPDTLNLKSKGKWITCYIGLPNGYDVNDIDISTVILEDTLPAKWGDIQGDTLMVKFDRSEVEDMLSPGTYNLKVTGELADGTSFEGYSDEIRVIDPGK